MASAASDSVVGTEAALRHELDHIEDRRTAADPDYRRVPPAAVNERASSMQLSALCLSGGGIRSAAFCLGAIQSLAGRQLLNGFDYVSTVSGGGFIGGWLQVLIQESGDIEKAQKELASHESGALRRLRGFTNYLTPQNGPFSTDTWAAIVMYIRNLLLNWMVFTPAFLLLALGGIGYRTITGSLVDRPGCIAVLLVAATAALIWSTWQGCELIPSHRTAPLRYAPGAFINRHIVAPVILWAFLAPVIMNHGVKHPAQASWWVPIWSIPACYAAAMLAGYAIAWLRGTGQDKASRDLYQENAVRWVVTTACGTALTIIAIALIVPSGVLYAAAKFQPVTKGPSLLVDSATALGALGPLWFLGTHVLHTVFYVAFRREALHADLDREWLGRLNGVLLRFGAAWAAFALACLVVPVILAFAPSSSQADWRPDKVAALGSGTTLAGALGAWVGKKAWTGLQTYIEGGQRWMKWLPSALAVVFAVGVLSTASSLLQWGLGQLGVIAGALRNPDYGLFIAVGLQACAALLLVALVHAFGRVNVNRYSMHAVYRNRLARAFLGCAREDAVRGADPFTGFDPADNPPFKTFLRPVTGQRLFPVINATLNVTSSSNAAMAERKAESFAATPQFCGSAELLDRQGAFVPTELYAGMESLHNENGRDNGPRLGTLLTISGAALSPNWGYHSSRLTAFLMTLFNVRLGVWLPNPANATDKELQLSKPANSEAALFNELLGQTTDNSQAIYLSDGGHFENLGVYEMLRRRCRRILVIDSGQDSDCAFADLGNAIRKARIDLDADIRMPAMQIYARKLLASDKNLKGVGFARGTVVYAGGATGEILYVKPSYVADIPADVRAYGASDESFPHDSTSAQWFTESQFESYRALGRWQMDQVAGTTLDELFAAPAG